MPQGKGFGSGSGQGAGRQQVGCSPMQPGGGRNSAGGGRGRNNGGSFGAGGDCICAGCGHKSPHERGVKCTDLKCPECGRTMVREELFNSRSK